MSRRALAQGGLLLPVDPTTIATSLGALDAAQALDLLTFAQSFTLRRRGVETRIMAGETLPAPDEVLQRRLAEAHTWARAWRIGTSLTDIAGKTGRSEPYIRTHMPLAFRAPSIPAAILEGQQPANISVARLLRDGIPVDWIEGARLFGVCRPARCFLDHVAAPCLLPSSADQLWPKGPSLFFPIPSLIE